jgi:hypothetical protein
MNRLLATAFVVAVLAGCAAPENVEFGVRATVKILYDSLKAAHENVQRQPWE